MKKPITLSLLPLCVICLNLPAVVMAGDFAWRSLERIAEKETENLIYSPTSLEIAFGMLYAGTRGNSESEVRQVLGFGGQEETHAKMASLLAAIEAADAAELVQLRTANSLWMQEGFTVFPEYLDLLSEAYKSVPYEVDFKIGFESARLAINGWVEEKTENRIQDLFAKGMINTDTRLVLVNALYFKAPWLKPFLPHRTQDADFYVSESETISVRMMNGGVSAPFKETDYGTWVELPFRSGDKSGSPASHVVMTFFLPKEGEPLDLGALCDYLRDGTLSLDSTDWAKPLIRLSLPRFKVESDLKLNPILQDMGMVTLFESVDLGGMTNTGNLKVAQVVQKAFIEVIEEGAEAAAATGITFEVTSAPMYQEYLTFDRPFAFFIREKTTDTVLFAGKVVRPESPDESVGEDWQEELKAVIGGEIEPLGHGYETVLGRIHPERFPWIRHESFGWMQLWGNPGSLWMWIQNVGWLWTDTVGTYPHVHDTAENRWLRLYPEGLIHPWMYDIGAEDWVLGR